MKSIVYALIGIVLYGIQNAVIDVKLKQFSTVSLLLGMYAVLFPLALCLFFYQKYTGNPVMVPDWGSFGIVAAVAIMFFIADFFYIGAYTMGGNVVVITIMLVLMPVIGALIKFIWVKEVPTSYHIAGFILATAAVICVAIGNVKKPL
jgi:drug/metabolite transporter (DMT)-like permease